MDFHFAKELQKELIWTSDKNSDQNEKTKDDIVRRKRTVIKESNQENEEQRWINTDHITFFQ